MCEATTKLSALLYRRQTKLHRLHSLHQLDKIVNKNIPNSKKMKFRFCGDGDCPDWVLGEIISTLSLLDADKLKSLATIVAQRILGHDFDEAEVKSLTASISSDGKSAIACIHYLLSNAAKHSVSDAVFNEEIQQLGLPKQHAQACCSVLNEYAEDIRKKLIEKSFKINELKSFQFLEPLESTVNCSRMELKISQELVDGLPQDTTHILNIDNDQLKVLLDEMKLALSIMQKYSIDDINETE